MDLNKSVDIYCERIGTGFWAEPLNALSNIAFVIAALFAWKLYITRSKSDEKKDVHVAISIILAFIVGIGSFIFHTFATIWALLFDIIPIYIFGFYYFALAIRRIIGLNRRHTIVSLVVFASSFLLMGQLIPRGTLNGSSEYFPFVLALILLAVFLQYRKRPSAKYFWSAAATLSLSLFFRIIDLMVCPYISIGTHFLWHVLNGILFYILLRILIITQNNEGE